MALNSLGLGFVFQAKDLATPTMDRVTGKFRRLDRTTQAASVNMTQGLGTMRNAGLGMVLAGGLAVAGITKIADAAGKFKQELKAVQLIGNATNAELEQIEKKAIDVGLATKFAPLEIAEGFKVLAGQGVAVRDQLKLIGPAAQLATAGQIELDRSTAAVTGTIRSFGLSMEESSLVADKLTKITQLTNFQAKDFEAGLSKAAAAGGQFGQSLEDTLVLMGSLRNANIDASSSSTAVREAFRRIGSDRQAQKTLKKMGIALDDQNGKARRAIDIMFDLQKATEGMTDSQRNARIARVLGARGLLAFNSAMGLTADAVVNGEKVVLKGKAAFEELKKGVLDAEGTNKKFVDEMNNTFEGQKQLLRGAVETLKVTVGDAFLKVLFPMITRALKFITKLIKKFQALPDPVKQAIAKFMLVASVLTLVAGGFTMVTGQLGQMVIAARQALPALIPLMKILLPIAAATLLAVGAFKLFRFAYEENLGGIRDFLQPIIEKVSLFFRTMRQLFSDGFVSGDVLEELQKVENQGVVKLIGAVVRLGFRMKKFVEGVAQGFMKVIREMGPTVERLIEAFQRFGAALGFSSDKVDEFASGPSSKFLNTGKKLGEFFGKLVEFVVLAISTWLNVYGAAIETFKAGLDLIQPIFDLIGETFDEITVKLDTLANELGFAGGAGEALAAVFEAVGTVIGAVWTAIVTSISIAVFAVMKVFSFMITAITFVVEAFKSAKDGVVNAWNGVVEFFEGIWDGIKTVIDEMITTLVQVGSAIPEELRPEAVDNFIKERTQGLSLEIPEQDNFNAAFAGQPVIPFAAPVGAKKKEQAPQREAGVGEIADRLAAIMKDFKVDVRIDGEKVAEATQRGGRSNNAAVFGATPGLGE